MSFRQRDLYKVPEPLIKEIVTSIDLNVWGNLICKKDVAKTKNKYKMQCMVDGIISNPMICTDGYNKVGS